MKSLLCELATAFKRPDLATSFKELNLYSPANDYTCKGKERQFCTLCGQKEVGMMKRVKGRI